MPTNNHSDNLFGAGAPLEDEKLWDLLSLYVDGEADPAQAVIVEQMLSSDPAYRRDFDFLMQTSKTMHMLEEIAPPLSLRDAIYAGTLNRPTPVGRLRAAWIRATAPTFARYASVGGALAVAALGAVIVWPHLSSSSTQVQNRPAVAVVAPPPHGEVAVGTGASRIYEIVLPPMGPKRNPATAPQTHTELVENKHSVKPTFVVVAPKIGEKNTPYKVVTTNNPGPQNHYPPKIGAPHNEGVPTGNPSYSYDKKMDFAAAQDRRGTLDSSSGNDFGPTVVPNEDTATSHQTVAVTDPETNTPQPETQPKPTVHVAMLPPGASQNIAAAVIRHNITAKYSGYDRSVAENIQRHEVTIDVIKGSF
jgi:hypothetical protein